MIATTMTFQQHQEEDHGDLFNLFTQAFDIMVEIILLSEEKKSVFGTYFQPRAKGGDHSSE